MANKTTRTPSEVTQIAVMANDLKYVVKAVDSLNDKVDKNYATKDELKALDAKFDPVKRIVYGLVAVILVAVITALMAVVTRK